MENTSIDLDDSWGAGLPCDLARCIGDRLVDLARICFRAVCRSWRTALPAGRLTSIPSPFVVIPAIPDHRSLALPLVRSVVDSCGSTTSSPTAALALHVVVDSKLRCVGSSGGWLAVADSCSVIRLINALTLQEAACLPPLPRSARVSTSSTPGYLDHAIRDHHEHTIHKVAFSVKPPRGRGCSYAHSAAALHRATGAGHGLALTFTRAGWNHWMWRQPTTTYLPLGQDGHFDVAYCERSGVCYVVTLLAAVWVLDMSAPLPTLEPLLRCHAPPRELATFAERRHIVVLSDDDEDAALSQMYMVIIMEEQQQQHVIVQKYTAGKPWKVVSDLGGRALLVARRAQSMSVLPTASSPPWLRPDCIYWMTHDDDDEWYHDGCENEQEMMSPVWRFHVPTNTTDRFFQEEERVGADYSLDWDNSLWLTPSLT